MRTRTRTIVSLQRVLAQGVNVPCTVYTCAAPPAPGTTNSVAQTIDMIVKEESIRDELGSESSHPVYHRSRTRTVEPVGYGDLISQNVVAGYVRTPGLSYRWPYYQAAATNNAQSTAWDVTNVLGSVPTKWTIGSLTTDQETYLKESVLRAARGLKADVLLDLIQGYQLWPAIRDMLHYLPAMAKNWKSARKMVRTSSNAYLAWKFGIGPVIQDVMQISRYVSHMRDDIQRHVNMEVERYSQKAIIAASCSATPDGYTLYGQNYLLITVLGRVIKDPTVRYVLKVKPNAQHCPAFFKKAEKVMSRFATSPASLAWELIPFSFMLDWFVDLRGMLRAVDDLIGFSPYEIVDFTRSYSYELLSDVSASYCNTCNGVPVVSGRSGTVEFKHYERSLVSHVPSWAFWKPRFGKNQAGITAAMIGQRLDTL